MSLKLNWVNPNGAVDSITIYRSQSKIDPVNLPEPLATLPGAATSYTDTTATRNTLYYYVIAVKKGDEVALTNNRALAYMPYVGPGPQSIVRGDYEYGYMGSMPLEDLASAQEFYNLFGFTSGTVTTGSISVFKVIVKCKIYYLPNLNFVNSVNFDALYKLGLVFGMEDFSQHAFGQSLITRLGNVPQKRLFTKGEHQFVVRLPTSRLNHGVVDSNTTEYYGGEWDTIYGPLLLNREVKYNPLQMADYFNSNEYILTSDAHSNNTNAIVRGSTTGDRVTNLAVASNSSTTGWRPFIELVV